MRLFFLLCLIGFPHFLLSQNLITNPSFEDSRCCPDGYSQFHCTLFWTKPTKGTSDYYSGCENRFYSPEAKVPKNFFGHQNAHTGNAYIGLYAFYHDDYREYIQTKLDSNLKKGQEYCLSFQVSLADTAGIAIGALGIHFSDTLIRQAHYFPLNVPHIDLELPSGHLQNKSKWVELFYTYTATGNEQFLIIGNFQDNLNTDTISARNQHTGQREAFVSYYYIDDVCLGEVKTDNTCTCINNGQPPIVERTYTALEIEPTTPKNKPTPKVGDRVILKNIYFEFDKAVLLLASDQEIEKLYNLLLQYPTMTIKISGHTDSKGNHRYNLALSESRALAVYTALVKKGIASNRLDFEGFGKTQPIATNETNDGRQMNRRVEFEVIYINTSSE